MPHGPNVSLSPRRCLVTSWPFVRQDKYGKTCSHVMRLMFLTHIYCVLRSESHCGKHLWPWKPWTRLCTVDARRVPCIHASRIMYPRKSFVHQACAISLICFTGDRSALVVRGRIVEAMFHLPMHGDKIRKLESLTACVLHICILEDWQDGKKEPHMAFLTKQERC